MSELTKWVQSKRDESLDLARKAEHERRTLTQHQHLARYGAFAEVADQLLQMSVNRVVEAMKNDH